MKYSLVVEYSVAVVATEPVAFAFDSAFGSIALDSVALDLVAFDFVAFGFVAFDFVASDSAAFASFVVVATINRTIVMS